MSHPDDSRASAGIPLRVGVLVDSMQQPRWIRTLLARIEASSAATIALVILADRSARGKRTGGGGRRWIPARLRRGIADRRHVLYALYGMVDDMLFPVRPDPLALASIEPLAACRSVLRVTPLITPLGERLSEDDLQAILHHDLDVTLHFGRRLHGGWGTARIARYGVWSCEPGGERTAQGSPAMGFWEMMNGEPTTEVMLRALGEEPDDDSVIGRSRARTDKRSLGGNRLRCCERASALVLRALRELHALGPSALHPAALAAPASTPSEQLARGAPTNGQMLVALTRKAGRVIQSRRRRAGAFAQWFIAYRLGPGADVGGASALPHPVRGEFQHILPPRDRFWADPFPVRWSDRYCIFVEEYLYERGRAHIAVLVLGPDGRWTPPVPVLERPYHLSYPYVFRWRGDYFMCPEARQSGAIELYRASAFPYEWELEATLLADVRAVDPTLVEIDGRWWMFTNIAPDGSSDPSCWDDDLHLFHAPSPLGPWIPHRRNPVKSDLRSARPAGRLLEVNGKLYRPAQDCAEQYGHAMVINRIVRIDPNEYREITVDRIPPDWTAGLLRTHTVNMEHDLTVVDGQLERSRRS